MKLRIPAEATVGLFVLIVATLFVVVSMRLGKFTQIAEQTQYTVRMVEAHGIVPDVVVEMDGVRVGKVTSVESDPHAGVIVTFSVTGPRRVHAGAGVGLKTSGMLGSRYVIVTRGDNTLPLLEPGAMLPAVDNAADLEQIMAKVSSAVDDLGVTIKGLKNVFGDTAVQSDLRETIGSIRAASERLEDILANFDRASEPMWDDISPTVKDIRVASHDLRELLARINQWSGPLTDNVEERLTEVSTMLKQVETAAREISEAVEDVQHGEGTIPMLLGDEELAGDIKSSVQSLRSAIDGFSTLHTYVGYRGELQFHKAAGTYSDQRFKHWVTLDLAPSDTMWYTFEVISDPEGAESMRRIYQRPLNSAAPTTAVEERVIEDRLEFSLLLNKRYRDLAFRLGIMENAGGWGLSYYFLGDKLQLHQDVYNFGRQDNWPVFRTRAEYRFLRYLRLSASVSDYMNVNYRSPFTPVWSVGGGFYFNDFDLKTLFLGAPSISAQ